MPNDTENPGSSSLLGSITRMLDANINSGAGPDNLISVLALLCLFSIVNKNNAVSQPVQAQSAASNNPLHKLLGDLTKGGDGGSGVGGSGLSPDTLMSLLPLLNSPQLKSKLNPGTMGTVLGLLNNLGGGGSQEKTKPESKAESKHEPKQEPQKQTEPPPQPVATQQPAPALKQQPVLPQEDEDTDDAEGKNYGRYLNWKNNF